MFDLTDCLTKPMVQTRGIKQNPEYTSLSENLKGGNKQNDATEPFVRSRECDAGWLKVKILERSLPNNLKFHRCERTVIRHGTPPSRGIQSSSWDSTVSKKISVWAWIRAHSIGETWRFLQFDPLWSKPQWRISTELLCSVTVSVTPWGRGVMFRTFAQWYIISCQDLFAQLK